MAYAFDSWLSHLQLASRVASSLAPVDETEKVVGRKAGGNSLGYQEFRCSCPGLDDWHRDPVDPMSRSTQGVDPGSCKWPAEWADEDPLRTHQAAWRIPCISCPCNRDLAHRGRGQLRWSIAETWPAKRGSALSTHFCSRSYTCDVSSHFAVQFLFCAKTVGQSLSKKRPGLHGSLPQCFPEWAAFHFSTVRGANVRNSHNWHFGTTGPWYCPLHDENATPPFPRPHLLLRGGDSNRELASKRVWCLGSLQCLPSY